MSGLLKFVLFIIIFYYIYKWFSSPFKNKSGKANNDKGVKIFKTKEIEKPKYNIEAETVEFEEIEENEPEK